MRKNCKRKIIVSCIASLGIGGLLLSTGVTLAAYSRKTRVDQNIMVANKKGTNIFLDATAWDIDGAVFYMFVWKQNDNSVVRKYLTPVGKTTEGYYIYTFQSTVHDRLLFLRVNPDSAGNAKYFGDNCDAFVRGVSWNKTEDTIYSSISSTPLCKITSTWSANSFIGTDSNVLGTVSISSWSAYTY